NGTITGTPTITNSGGSFQCTFGTGASSTVAVKVNDGTANSNESSIVVTLNRPPTVSAGGNVSGAEGSTIALHGTASDPDSDTCMVDWQDGPLSPGTVTETPQSGSGSCSATHAYTAPGVYTVTTTVTDDDGGSGSATTQVVIYDPSAGFITGGGWIAVDPGSLTTNPTASGRANFGFSSQYKKGATIPTGETEFNFQMGNFNFHSEAYTWLVV